MLSEGLGRFTDTMSRISQDSQDIAARILDDMLPTINGIAELLAEVLEGAEAACRKPHGTMRRLGGDLGDGELRVADSGDHPIVFAAGLRHARQDREKHQEP